MNMSEQQAAKAPPEPQGLVVARTVQIDVRESEDLHTGYSRRSWTAFMWLSGWRAWIVVRFLKLFA